MSSKQIAKSAAIVSVITMLSRVLGYIRDAISAAILGVGWVSDAFFVAFRIPNMLRSLLAEGALSSAFIPVFTDYLEKKDRRETWLLAVNVLNALSLLLVLITFAGIVFAPFIVTIMAPGFINDPQKFQLTVSLTRWLFPFILFVSIAALFLGILNSLKKFSIPAFAPVVLNVSMIASGVFICPRLGDTPEQQVYGWVFGALFGSFLEILIQWIPSVKEGLAWKPFINLKDEGLRRIGKLMIPATLAQSVTQINLLVNTILASLLAEGAVTYLYYGNRLMQLPLGVFGVAVATVAFPFISQYASRGDYDSLRDTIHSSLKQAFFVVLPASAGLIALSVPINLLLFNYGRFQFDDAIKTAGVSAVYCTAIFAHTGVKILTQVFYAINKAGTAVKISVSSMIINILLCVSLMFSMNYLGLALATSLAALIQFIALYFYLSKFINGLKTKEFLSYCVKVTVISLIMAGLSYLTYYLLNANFNAAEFSRTINGFIVLGAITVGVISYGIMAKLAGLNYAEKIMQGIVNRIKNKK